MICPPCKQAADGIAQATTARQAEKAAKGHAKCKGCDCQHKAAV